MTRRLVITIVLSFAAASLFTVSLEAAAGSRRRAVSVPSVSGPVAQADSYSVVRGQTLAVGVSKGVLANDSNANGKPLSASVATTPAHGTLVLNGDGGFSYVNDGSAATSDSFTYTASDGSVVSAPASVTITITENVPVATGDSFSATQGQSLAVPAPGVLLNDTLNGATIRSFGAVAGTEQSGTGKIGATAQGGTVNLQSDGSFSYSPNGNFTGSDGFKYVIANDAGQSAAAVSITVAVAPPVAASDSYSTAGGTSLSVPAPGVFANDSLNGANVVSYGTTGVEQTAIGSATATAQGGSVILGADGSFTYNPAASFSGTDTFHYVVRNAGGSSSATVSITVQTQTIATTFTVTSPGFFFSFSGVSGQNPQLTLTRGKTYIFEVSTAAIHPFEITGAPAGSVTNNNISDGTLTFVVPLAAANYAYDCSIHGFGGTIVTVP